MGNLSETAEPQIVILGTAKLTDLIEQVAPGAAKVSKLAEMTEHGEGQEAAKTPRPGNFPAHT